MRLNKIAMFCALCPLLANAATLPDYAAIKSAVAAGKQINITINFNHCTPSYDMSVFKAPRVILISESGLAFSGQHVTTNNPQFPNEAVIEQISYKLTPQGDLNIDRVLLDPTTYQVKADTKHTLTCPLGEAVQVYANGRVRTRAPAPVPAPAELPPSNS